MNRIALSASLILAFLLWVPGASARTNDKKTLDDAIHDLDLQKMRVTDLLAEAKSINDPDKKQQAKALYATARQQYNAFIDDIARQVQFGTKVDPQRHASDAKAASDVFSVYVQQNAPAAKAGIMTALLPIVGDLVKQFLGISGSDKASSSSYQGKKDLADQVRNYQWPAWDS